jgi:hypothetical protein
VPVAPPVEELLIAARAKGEKAACEGCLVGPKASEASALGRKRPIARPVDAKRTFDPRQVLDQEASVLNLDGATPFQRLN